VVRKDGFSGDITLALQDAPGGFRLSGAVVPAGQDRVRLTLTVPPAVTQQQIDVRVEGRATIQGKTVAHQAAPADEMMQAFAYQHLVPADELRVSVVGRGGTRIPASIVSSQPVRIPAGGTARVRVIVPPAYLRFDKVEFELSEPPDGITLRDSSLDPAGAARSQPPGRLGGRFGGRLGAPAGAQAPPGGQFVLQADAAKVKPGLRGNLIVTVSGERVPTGNQQATAARRRVGLGTLPAIAFEITSR